MDYVFGIAIIILAVKVFVFPKEDEIDMEAWSKIEELDDAVDALLSEAESSHDRLTNIEKVVEINEEDNSISGITDG